MKTGERITGTTDQGEVVTGSYTGISRERDGVTQYKVEYRRRYYWVTVKVVQ